MPRPRPIEGIETLEALEPFLTDDEALGIGIIRDSACNHPFVTAHAGPCTARVAAVVVLRTVGCTWVFRRSGGRIQLLEFAPVAQLCVFNLRG